MTASLSGGAALLTWTHDYTTAQRQEQNGIFIVYRAPADFPIQPDSEGFVWLVDYPQFVEITRFDATTMDSYLDLGGSPGSTYRYFVSYANEVSADRCAYVEISLGGGSFAPALASSSVRPVPAVSAIPAVIGAILVVRAVRAVKRP